MSQAGAQASAYDAAAHVQDGPAAERASRKRSAAVEYAERELAAAQDGMARMEDKATKFEQLARLVRDVELPEAIEATVAAEARLAQAREAAGV